MTQVGLLLGLGIAVGGFLLVMPVPRRLLQATKIVQLIGIAYGDEQKHGENPIVAVLLCGARLNHGGNVAISVRRLKCL